MRSAVTSGFAGFLVNCLRLAGGLVTVSGSVQPTSTTSQGDEAMGIKWSDSKYTGDGAMVGGVLIDGAARCLNCVDSWDCDDVPAGVELSSLTCGYCERPLGDQRRFYDQMRAAESSGGTSALVRVMVAAREGGDDAIAGDIREYLLGELEWLSEGERAAVLACTAEPVGIINIHREICDDGPCRLYILGADIADPENDRAVTVDNSTTPHTYAFVIEVEQSEDTQPYLDALAECGLTVTGEGADGDWIGEQSRPLASG